MTWLKEQRLEVRKADLNEDLSYALSRIREELTLKLKGMDASRRVQLENDVQVQRAKDAIGIALRYSGPKP